MNRKKSILCMTGLVLLLCTFLAVPSKKASAADVMIAFSADRSSMEIGETVNVNINFGAIDNISVLDVYVSYDSSRMEYISSGERGISGGSGLLHISADKTTEMTANVSYQLSFRAIASGTCSVSLSDQRIVRNLSGYDMTTSSNRVSIKINGNVAPASIGDTQTTQLSSDNLLTSLRVSAGELTPAFKSNKTKYTLEVTNDVSELFLAWKTSDPDADVRIDGNEMLFDGDNEVKVIVTAPNGDEKVYKINVHRESLAESKKRQKDDSNKGLGFSIYEDEGLVYLQNKYKLAVVDVDESDEVPAGFRKTSVLLYGINVTAYAVASDLDSDYLIMYCMDENGDKDFYQFDRSDKTLTRYTGDLIDRINANKGNESSDDIIRSEEYQARLNQMAIIIALLVALCVMLIIIIISVVLRQVKMKSKKIEDELDF